MQRSYPQLPSRLSLASMRLSRPLDLTVLLIAVSLFGPFGLVRAQTIYSPTSVSCDYNPLSGSNVTNPTGPETQSGGRAGLFSNPPAPPRNNVYPICSWAAFGSGTLSASATLSVPFQYLYPGSGGAHVSWYCNGCTGGGGGTDFSSDFNGTVYFTIPVGTDLSTLSVLVSVNGAVGHAASGYVGWINLQ